MPEAFIQGDPGFLPSWQPIVDQAKARGNSFFPDNAVDRKISAPLHWL